MAKKKKKSSTLTSKIINFFAWLIAIIALVSGTLAIGYYIGYDNAKTELREKEQKKEQRRLVLLKQIESKPTENVRTRLKKILEKETKEKKIDKKNISSGASHEYTSNTHKLPPKRVKKEVKSIYKKKPRLAIILDDVSSASQVRAIKSLKLNVTMSFLPPSKGRPHSARLAAKEKFYMVHLPMEAQNYSAEEPNTLRINDSQYTISQRVKTIKKLFPKVRYLNNHTGSKFTSDEVAMNRLISALNKNNISFIDSRTTAKTKAPSVMKNFGLKYVSRDVFLDHDMDKASIIKQIQRAISIAKSEGMAIAIGHPHTNTILALHESKKLFKNIDLVLINKIY